MMMRRARPKARYERPDYFDQFEDPIRKGYTRRYFDHTGRWYKDYSPRALARVKKAEANDPLLQILLEEIQKEVNKEIIDMILGRKS